MGSRRHLALPESLQGAVRRLGEDIRSGRNLAPGLAHLLEEYDTQQPPIAISADREIANVCGLYHWTKLGHSELDLLAGTPGLEWLYIFHGNGHLREAALERIADPPRDAFLFTALAYRLNDWVGPVRAAAERCARRVFPTTNPAVVAVAAMFLLERRRHWRRWQNEAATLDDAIARHDVAGPLVSRILVQSSGPTARILGQALRSDGIDRYLPDVALSAALPAVRAIAFHALIDRRAVWFEGYENQWVDKSLGVSRRMPTLGGRNLTYVANRETAIAQAASDRAAIVRKVAADGLIKYRDELTNIDAISQILAIDMNAAIRERIAFLLRVARGGNASPG